MIYSKKLGKCYNVKHIQQIYIGRVEIKTNDGFFINFCIRCIIGNREVDLTETCCKEKCCKILDELVREINHYSEKNNNIIYIDKIIEDLK